MRHCFMLSYNIYHRASKGKLSLCSSTIFHQYIYQREGVAEVSQIFLRDTHVLPKLFSYEKHCRCER
jgi:hypothetical protein